MSKRLAIAVVACACVAVAYGAVTKINSFVGFGPDSDADGMAILNFKQGQNNTVAQVILSDLSVTTQYVLVLRDPGTWTLDTVTNEAIFEDDESFPGTFFFPISAGTEGQISTDSKGHLTFHGQTTLDSGDFSDNDVLIFWFIDWNAAFQGLPGPQEPPATELRIRVRLIGDNPPAP